MKIVIIGPIPPPINGCSYANFILCNNLKKAGYKYKTINTSTSVISSKQGNSFSFKKAFSFISIYFSIYKLIGAKKVYFTPGQTFFGIVKYAPFILLCILLRKPYVIHVHGNYLGKQYQLLSGMKKKIFKYLISKTSAGIVLSESLRSNFDQLLPVSKVFVVENFVEDSIFDYVKNKTKPTAKMKILYLSNLMREKGVLELLDALLKIKKMGIEFEAIFAGAIENEIALEVHDKMETLGETCKYVGVIQGNKKNDYLWQSNVFVLPTYYKMEGQPISILEALATGNIIVTTKQGGIPDIIKSENGLFVEPRSSESIVNTLTTINSNFQETLKTISNKNIKYANLNFTEQKFTQKILSVLNTI